MVKITNNKKNNNLKYYSTGRLTNIQKNSFKFKISLDLHEVIIGSSLGDLNINKLSNNFRLRFKQGLNNINYLNHLFELFSDYSNFK